MWGAAMAASTVATIPIAGLFVFFQRYFIKGLTAAAVKG
jgi:multiple sugar transport system permease protein/arabinosaccharide transport system permease protein